MLGVRKEQRVHDLLLQYSPWNVRSRRKIYIKLSSKGACWRFWARQRRCCNVQDPRASIRKERRRRKQWQSSRKRKNHKRCNRQGHGVAPAEEQAWNHTGSRCCQDWSQQEKLRWLLSAHNVSLFLIWLVWYYIWHDKNPRLNAFRLISSFSKVDPWS